jgi:putative phosphoribosyl transferase
MRTAELTGRNFAMALKRLPDRPDLEQYRRQAKDLHKALAAADPAAIERLRLFHPRAEDGRTTKLADAQLVIARELGFASWPAFAAQMQTLQAEALPIGIACERGTLAVEIAGAESAGAVVLFVLAGNVGPQHAGIRQIADHLRRAGHVTVLPELLTADEALQDAIEEELRLDVRLLAARAELVLDRIRATPRLAHHPLALFCAGAGGAAGIALAARRREAVSAIISAAGRPDLAGADLARVRAPSLFMVGSEDAVAHGFTRTMLPIFPRDVANKLEVVRGVGLRFEEGPAAARAAQLATGWLKDHLPATVRAEQVL